MPRVDQKVQKITTNIYIGIDPGKSGGLAALHVRAGEIVGISTQPMVENKHDVYKWLLDITKHGVLKAVYIEKVHAMPKQGVTSMFSFGQSYGTLLGMVVALQHVVPFLFQERGPKTWQKHFGLVTEKLSSPAKKELLRAHAQQTFPHLPLWNQTLGKQRAVCDALLIAKCCFDQEYKQ